MLIQYQPVDSLNSSPTMTFAFTQPPALIPMVELPWSWHYHLQHTLYYPNIKPHPLHPPPLTFSVHASWLFPSCCYCSFFPRITFSSATTLTPAFTLNSHFPLSTEHVCKIPNLGSNQFFIHFSQALEWLKSDRKDKISLTLNSWSLKPSEPSKSPNSATVPQAIQSYPLNNLYFPFCSQLHIVNHIFLISQRV